MYIGVIISDEKGEYYLVLRDKGHGTFIQKWDHVIQVTNMEHGCTYTDTVDIEAGFLTPVITEFAWYFYRYCQKRWKTLDKNGLE